MASADFEILDTRFGECVKTRARVEKLFEGCRWAEGPAYFPAGRYLVWSDIPNDRILRWDEPTGTVGTGCYDERRQCQEEDQRHAHQPARQVPDDVDETH